MKRFHPQTLVAMALSVLPFTSVCGELCHDKNVDLIYCSPSNGIVVTPIGYEKSTTLNNGESVKSYSDVLSQNDVTNCHAVMFLILSPNEHRGRQFVLRHSGCTCYMCQCPSPMTNLYQVGKFYLFDSQYTVSNIFRSAYAASQHVLELKMERDWGKRFYCDVEEIDSRIKELDDFVLQCQLQLEKYRGQLQQVPNGASQRRKRHELKCHIIKLEEQLTNSVPKMRSELIERRKCLLPLK